MLNDDIQVGRLLKRREVLATLGVAGLAMLAGRRLFSSDPDPFPRCVVRPAQTLGPYFVDERLERSDIRSDPATGAVSAGAPLALRFTVSRIDAGGCTPLSGAQVDIWQCDAAGVYSDVVDPRFNTVGQRFLRGYQFTDRAGRADFTTIYPGWYQGRTVHIHFKIQSEPSTPRAREFVSQIYFDDELTDRVHASAPYAERGTRTVRNDRDGIFRRGGSQLMVDATPASDGYAANFEIGLDLG